MSDEKYIIAVKNSEPAPPELEYVCGPKATGTCFGAIVDLHEVLWDDDISKAYVFRSMEDVVDAYTTLVEVDCDESRMAVYKRVVSYHDVDKDLLKCAVKENRVQRIIDNIPTEDLDYLKDIGVLDLTIVT